MRKHAIGIGIFRISRVFNVLTFKINNHCSVNIRHRGDISCNNGLNDNV